MPYLTGDRIMLREYRMTDLPHIREWVNDPEITDNLSDIFLYPQTVENTEQFVNSMIQGSPNHKGFVIADKVTQDYIGQIDLVDIDWKNRTASLGIVIGKKPYLGQGYGSEAIRLLQELAFHSLNLHRLELMVYEFNERALRCYRKCGFREEGRLRQKLYRKGRYWDVIWMGILREEYEQMRAENGQS
jgi:RimJ/RimL family protein N-acetyltransferase